MVRAGLMASALVLVAALADCIDINAEPADRLTAITHINDERALQSIARRPWSSVASLTGINGIGRGRIRNILEQDLACVRMLTPAGEWETIEGVATVLDADTFEVAGERVRLIGIDAPERRQTCTAAGHDWPCAGRSPPPPSTRWLAPTGDVRGLRAGSLGTGAGRVFPAW